MADSPIDVGLAISRSTNAVSTALRKATKQALKDGQTAARKELLKRAALVPGGDRRFSNMAGYNHGGRLNVKTSTCGDTVWIMSKGPWKLAETGAAPHRMGRGTHPGTRSSQGRKSWTLGQAAVFDELGRTIPEDIGAAVERAFGG